MISKVGLLLLVSLTAYSCTKDNEEIASLMSSRNIREMVRTMNKYRYEGAVCGDSFMIPVQKLIWVDKLAELSLHKSYDLYDNNYFDHSSPGGIVLTDRLDSINYLYLYHGEYIAVGALDVKEVMQVWLSSEGHCRNMMNPSFTHFGAAQYGTYWTQEFIGR